MPPPGTPAGVHQIPRILRKIRFGNKTTPIPWIRQIMVAVCRAINGCLRPVLGLKNPTCQSVAGRAAEEFEQVETVLMPIA
jgi:hypothetical protein